MSLGGLVAYGDSDGSETSDVDDITDTVPETLSLEKQTEDRSGRTSASGLDSGSDSQTHNVDHQTKDQASEGKGRSGHDDTSSVSKVTQHDRILGSVDDIVDEDDFGPANGTLQKPDPTSITQGTGSGTVGPSTSFSLNLPAPKNSKSIDSASGAFVRPTTQSSQNLPISNENVFDETPVSESKTHNLLEGLPAPKIAATKPNDLGIEEDEIEEEIKQKASKLAALAKPPPKPSKRQPIKITVPSLEDYDSDEEDQPKKKRPKKPSSGKPGLFALLPEPKNFSVKSTNRPLIPYSLSKKSTQSSTSAKKAAPPKPTKKAAPAPILPGIPLEVSDDEDEVEGPVSFFSLGESSTFKINTAPLVEATEKIEPILLGPWQTKSNFSSDPSLNPLFSKAGARDSQVAANVPSGAGGSDGVGDAPLEFSGPSTGPSYSHPQTQAYTHYAGVPDATQDYPSEDNREADVEQYLQDEEFLKLAGKRQRGKEKIEFINLQAQEHGNVEQLTKNLTEEVSGFSYSRKKDEQPSSQSRRKHQITYLAHQAKERELELKNQWAHNKMSRRQTQSKYGF